MTRASSRSGMTLIEVLLASAILATGLTAILVCLTTCLGMIRASRVVADAQTVLGLGELKYPMRSVEELEDLEIDGDTTIAEGYTFSRHVDEKELDDDEEDDGLYVVRVRVSWGSGKEGEYEEVVRLVWMKPEDAG